MACRKNWAGLIQKIYTEYVIDGYSQLTINDDRFYRDRYISLYSFAD